MKREEEYLEAIYILELNKGYARVKDLALILKVKPSSIVNYLVKLANKGYIVYERGKPIKLTSKGRDTAKRIYHKHKVIKDFLSLVLEIPEEIAEKDACYIEHGIHDETLRKMEEILRKRKNTKRSKL